jgi:hypothetical protein
MESTLDFVLIFGIVQVWEYLISCHDEVDSASESEEVRLILASSAGVLGRYALVDSRERPSRRISPSAEKCLAPEIGKLKVEIGIKQKIIVADIAVEDSF